MDKFYRYGIYKEPHRPDELGPHLVAVEASLESDSMAASRYGLAVFRKAITIKEIEQHGLVPIPEPEDLPSLVEQAARILLVARDDLAEMQAVEPVLIRGLVIAALRKIYPHGVHIDDYERFCRDVCRAVANCAVQVH